jgi:hypothetical protein
MFAAREEAVVHSYHCVRKVAQRVGLGDLDWKGTDEVLGELAKKDAETHGLLVRFLVAYRAWSDHHIDTITRKTGTSEFEKGKMAGLVQARDIHRKDLQTRLAALPT